MVPPDPISDEVLLIIVIIVTMLLIINTNYNTINSNSTYEQKSRRGPGDGKAGVQGDLGAPPERRDLFPKNDRNVKTAKRQSAKTVRRPTGKTAKRVSA